MNAEIAPEPPMLPAGWRVRRPTLDDVPAILAVVHASDIAAVGEPDFTAEETVEILTGPNHDPQRDSWLVVDATGTVVAWAYIVNTNRGERDLIEAYAHPEQGGPAQPYLIDLLVARVAERAAEFGYPVLTARAGAIASETEYTAALTRRGFAFVKRYARMRRDLAVGEAPPAIPEGAVIRPVRHADDAEMREFHRILETAFSELPDYLPTDYDTYRQRLAALPAIDWAEWFIAEVDGVPAAILQSGIQGVEQDEGWVRNLAVLPRFRGRGLGAALLRTAFATYAAKGRTCAGLGVDMTNPTCAYRLYLSVGMYPMYEADVYERAVAAAPR